MIDYDEFQIGERKERVDTAVRNFIRKVSGGVAIRMSGLLLQWLGHGGKAETQVDFFRTMILIIAGGLPASGYVVGMILFSRFSLSESEHARVLVRLRERRGEGPRPGVL